MANLEPILPIEQSMHRRRVADLCGRVARAMSIEGLVEFALALAASVHTDRPSAISGSHLVADGKDASFVTLVVGMAEAILHPRRGKSHGKLDRDVELGAQILEACDEFDEAVEFASYDGTSIRAAIDAFLADAAPRFDSRIARALREITSPRVGPTLSGQLPVLPAAAAKLMRTSAEGVSVFELESIAGSDPVLAGRLLAASNSAFFGFTSEIRNLRQAILRLGVPFARKVLMDAALGPLFASSTLVELWRHSRLVAATAHELAGECGCDQEVAYVAGLLHDIGRLVIHRCPQEMRVDEVDRFASGFPRTYAETLVYGTDHATIGGELLKDWGLPSEIVDAVALHHCPERTDSPLAAILYLAEDEVAIDAAASENLSPGMRRAIAIEVAGVDELSGTQINLQSAIFALTG